MGTKSPLNPYGTKNRDKINFAYSKDFNRNEKMLVTHYNQHKKSVGAVSVDDYVKKANHFANDINITNKSFVSKSGATYKYNSYTKEMSVTLKDGITVTYFRIKSSNPDAYWERVKKRNDVEEKNATS